MALNQLGLGFVFTARDRATATIQRVGNAFDRQATRARLSSGIIQAAAIGIGASMAQMAAGLATLRGGFDIAREAGQAEMGLARVRAITRAGAEDMTRLRDAAIEAGIRTQFSPQEAIEGLQELGVRGFNATESIRGLNGVLDFAGGAQISVAQGAQTVGAALRVFGMQADQAGLAADRLLRISNLTALQGNELALALGNVSRGAGLTDQNMNEMLISMGLVRNTGVEASVAASSVSSGLIFMTRNAREIQRTLGVSVTETLADGTIRMRDFLDVVLEASEAAGERFPDAAERGATWSRLFGRFGLTAANAIGTQLRNGVRNANGEIVRGADAIEYMRETMRGARGTAAEFRRTLLDTFEGQLILLRGTVQTLRVVLGEAFATAFRPFVTALTDTLNVFIRIVNGMPAPLKTAIAAIVLGIGALLTAFGALGAIGFSVALIIPFLKVIAITMGVILLATLPAIAAIGALTLAVVALVVAFRRDVGGIATFFRRVWGQISLGFRAIRELFARGGFSKEVSRELGLAENQGLRRFVINVFALGTRLRRFFTGVRRGFEEAFKSRGADAVRALIAAFRQLGRSLGFIDDAVDGVAGGSMQDFIDAGVRVGEYVARGLVIVIDVIRQLVNYWQGLVAGFREWAPVFRALFDALRESLGRLAEAFREAFGQAEVASGQGRDGQSVMRDLGTVVAHVVVPAIILMGSMLGAAIETLAFLVRAGTWANNVLRDLFQSLNEWINRQISAWIRFRQTVIETFDEIAGRALILVRMIPAPVRERLGLGGAEQFLAARTQARTNRVAQAAIKEQRRTAGEPAAAAQPSLVETVARRTGRTAELEGLRREMASSGGAAAQLREAVGAMRLAAAQPINVQIDGETIARATRGGSRSAAAGEFAPVGVGED